MSLALSLCVYWLLSSPKPNSAPLIPGIVVEEVGRESADQVAGIKPGDILVAWVRGRNNSETEPAAHGDFHSPFDLETVAVDQAPRGHVAITGSREGRRTTFDLFPDNWKLVTRPRFAGPILAAYLAGQDLIRKKKLEQGAETWQDLGTKLSVAGDHVSAAWLLLRAADTLADDRKQSSAYSLGDLAIQEAESSKNPSTVAQALIRAGAVRAQFGDFAEARQYYERALTVQEKAGVGPLELASTLHEISHASTSIDDLVKGEEYGKRALKIRQDFAPLSLSLAGDYLALSNVAWRSNDFALDEDYCRRALAITQQLVPGTIAEAHALTNLSVSTVSRGNFALADDLQRKALTIRERVAPSEVPGGLENLGNIAMDRGDLVGAEAYLLRGLTLAERDAPGRVFFILRDLGTLAQRSGNFPSADRYFQRALAAEMERAPEGRNAAWAFTALGSLRRDQKDMKAAEDYYRRALAIRRKLTPDGPQTAYALARLSDVAGDRGDWESARTLALEALAMREKINPDGLLVAASVTDLARIAESQSDFAEAEHLYTRALSIRRRLAPETLEEAAALHSLGELYRRRGRLEESADYLRQAVEVVEKSATRIGGSDESKRGFSQTYANYYQDYIDVLVQLGRRVDAFDILERSRARLLLAMIAERDLVMDADIPADLQIDRRHEDAEYDALQDQLASLSPKRDAEKIAELRTRLQETRARQLETAGKIKLSSPRYASLRYSSPLSLAATQGTLDSGTLLLSYSVGKDRSFLFVVSAERQRGPLLAVYTIDIGEKRLRDSVEAFRNLIEWSKSSQDMIARGRSLYDALLKPAEASIASCDRVLILPGGPLHALPWGALVRGAKAQQPQYLVDWKPIHTVVSATVYAGLTKTRRQNASTPAIEVAAFGDPRYPKLAEKPLAAKRGQGEVAASDALADDFAEVADTQLRSVVRRGFRFEPLMESRKEVEQIAKLYAPKSEVYLGPEATEERAKSIGKGVPLIHFATHAVMNERFPLDSALVFTIPEYQKEGQDNGLLQAWEIFEKVRVDADLVTLSACESGLGMEMGGEGLIGLTRAFQYAGARTVLASLWKVEDKATAELMKRFYTYLKSGKTKDEALQSAQIDLIHSKEYSNPRGWAAFQLNGDWR